jgi:hypothetical protein
MFPALKVLCSQWARDRGRRLDQYAGVHEGVHLGESGRFCTPASPARPSRRPRLDRSNRERSNHGGRTVTVTAAYGTARWLRTAIAPKSEAESIHL